MANDSELKQRVIELEIKITHIQHAYDQLNEVVTQQAMRQDRIQAVLKSMKEKMDDLKSTKEPAQDPLDEKPPHY
ncbi:SlyX family protein [Novipirellula sp. SH528]|uniref:SlyX family protein n=1 Tax=Novipirellula sp. SH528 TaxID=3454466 RepID=UPI003FA18275